MDLGRQLTFLVFFSDHDYRAIRLDLLFAPQKVEFDSRDPPLREFGYGRNRAGNEQFCRQSQLFVFLQPPFHKFPYHKSSQVLSPNQLSELNS